MAFSPTEKKWKTSRLNYGDEKLYFSRKMCFEWLAGCKRIPILRDSAITSISKMSVFYCFLLFIRLCFCRTVREGVIKATRTHNHSAPCLCLGGDCVFGTAAVCAKSAIKIASDNETLRSKKKMKIECRSFSPSHRGKFRGNEQFMKFPPPSSHTISVRNVFFFIFVNKHG